LREANIPGLTSVRFFAALWVVLFHLLRSWSVVPRVGGFLKFGYSGVSFFFVLSGFILSVNYLQREFAPGDFWIARIARILPAYLVALAVVLPFTILAGHKTGTPFFPSALAPLFLLQAWIPKTALFWNSPGWSLSCEAFFYLLFPMMLVPAARVFRRHFVVMFVAMWILSAVPVLWYAMVHPEGFVDDTTSHLTLLSIVKFNPLLRLPEFLLGIGLGVLYLDGIRVPKPRTVALICVASLLAIFGVLADISYPALHNGFLAPIYGLLILALASSPDTLNRPVLVLLGEASYSLYLFHIPVYYWCEAAAKRLGWDHNSAFYVGYLVLAVLASIVSYKLIEVPGRMFVRSRFANNKRPKQLEALPSTSATSS
jgi:peptidoglycan/LPS O-acetylase OafA/YrhL